MDAKFTHVAKVRDFGQIVEIRGTPMVRVYIKALLSDSKCFQEIKPYLMNGSISGHKIMDALRMVDILMKHDARINGEIDDEASGLRALKLDAYSIAKQLMIVLRSRYTINPRYWKIESENTKRVLLPAKAQEE